ncbi:MAG: hypothetical protein QOG94_374 [Solirubrobacteraceae bacterium]|jgi:5-methylcytosine-specific restriction endonuclease McrA|nr:hypothetical protein [Solirubrobacteraceae bacterium]
MSAFESYDPRPRFAAMAEGSPLSEQQETELAAQALEIYAEEELEQFVRNVLEGVATGAGESIQRGAARQLGGVLKGIGAATLPAGGALVSLLAPAPGEIVGSKLGWMIDRTLELELEGVDREDAERERARRYVGLAATSARHAALAPPTAPPRLVAQSALADALAEHVPELFEAAVTGQLSPYQDKPDPKSVRGYAPFTAAQKHNIIMWNKLKNHGVIRSDDPLDPYQVLVDPPKMPPNAWAIDHIWPRSKGGTNSYKNARVISSHYNIKLGAKESKLPPMGWQGHKQPVKPRARRAAPAAATRVAREMWSPQRSA